jgi:DNA-binding LytR/AlgR family response regulator
MNSDNDGLKSYVHSLAHAGQAIHSSSFTKSFRDADSVRYIRFEDRREKFAWIHADEICFVKSADHYVKAWISSGNHLKWMTKHSTLKELLQLLPPGKFIRLNKFYLLNLSFFSHFNEKQKILYFKNDVSIAIPHRISPFVRQLLETNYT